MISTARDRAEVARRCLGTGSLGRRVGVLLLVLEKT
jgi:hypothetical protein